MKYHFILLLTLSFLGSGCLPDAENVNEYTETAPEVNREFIHEKFVFTAEDFEEQLTGLSIAAAEDPAGFLSIAARMLEMPPEYLFLVDKNHVLDSEFLPEDSVDLASYPELIRGRDGLILNRMAAEALVNLSEAAAAEGITLVISSAYRSYEYQQGLFSRFAEKDGEEATARYSARAGMSQHQLGTTVDFGDISNAFSESTAGIWMAENAGEYGWSLSYPQGLEAETGYAWESWHWRWIGTDAVSMQDEYFDGVQQRMMIFWDVNVPRLREAFVR